MPIKTNIGTLSIPRNIFGGTTCMFSPVHYLQDTSATCLYEATSSACNEPTLNALNYLMLHDLVSPSCPNIPRILNENAGTSFSPLTVEYYCLKNNTDYFISNILQKKDEEIITESLFASSSSAKVLSERCSFDDAKTRPPSPVFSNLTNTCDNVVLNVNYKFSWNALQIQSILAKITLGSFPISTIKEAISTYSFPITLIITPTASPSSVVSAEISYFRSSSALAFAQPSSPNSTSSSVIQPSPPVLSASLGFQSSVVAPAPQLLTVVTFSSTVITRNVTIVPTVIQRYTVGFGHVSVQQQSYSINGSVSVLVSRAVVTSNNETTLTRSGNPGYVLGRPLMTQTSTEVRIVLLRAFCSYN